MIEVQCEGSRIVSVYGCATVKDIRKYGMIQASLKNGLRTRKIGSLKEGRFWSCNDDRLKAVDDFSKNKISNNQYLTMVTEINSYIKEVFKEIKKESEE